MLELSIKLLDTFAQYRQMNICMYITKKNRDVESEISRSQNILKEENQQLGEFVCRPSKAPKLSKTNSFNTETHAQNLHML